MSFATLFDAGKDPVRAIETYVSKLNQLKTETDCEEHAKYAADFITLAHLTPDLRRIDTTVQAWLDANTVCRAAQKVDPEIRLLSTTRAIGVRNDVITAIQTQLLVVLRSLYATLNERGLQQTVGMVYHATTTGQNNVQLLRFFQMGASASLVGNARKQNTNTNQIPGFYVWRNLANARVHATTDLVCEKHEHRAVLALPYNPSLDWGIDAEANCARLSIFLAAHISELQAIPDGTLHTGGEPIFTTKCAMSARGGMMVYIGSSSSNISIGTTDNNLKIAAQIGALYEGMRQLYPQITEPFQRSLLADSHSANAIVYRGTDPIPVLNAEVLIEGKWIDARGVIEHPQLLELKE